MDRIRLSVLALCALLTTTINPFSDKESNTQPTHRVASNASSPAVSAAPPVSHETIAQKYQLASSVAGALNEGIAMKGISSELLHVEKKAEDRARSDAHEVALILKRLSIRHTALPDRERVALAHAIVREARKQGLAPSLVVSVIEVESAGYHLAVSHVGAMGLMQLLPATAAELAEKHDVEWHGPETLFDPQVNVKLGTAYLRQLTDQFGSVSTALAAYNWGPGRINRRLRRGDSVPSIYVEQVRAAQNRNTTLASL